MIYYVQLNIPLTCVVLMWGYSQIYNYKFDEEIYKKKKKKLKGPDAKKAL